MTLTLKTLPTVKGFRSVDFGLDGRSQEFTSPLAGTSQIAVMAQPRWRGIYETPPLSGANARTWRAFLASLRGRECVFYGHDPSFDTFEGLDAFTVDPSAPTFDSDVLTWDSDLVTFDAWAGPLAVGAPTVREAGQTGAVLKTTGWLAGMRIYEGEYIAFDATDARGNVLRALHIVETAITVGAGGDVNLTLSPPVRIAPDLGAAIETVRPGCTMRLADDSGGRWVTDEHGHSRIRFEAVQVLVGPPSA